MDFHDYKPSPAALTRLAEVDFVAVIGPTAAGKTTLLNRILARNDSFHMVLVTTSRARRNNEREEIDYHFRSVEEMQGRVDQGEFVQVAPAVFGDIYATAPEDYTTEGTAVMPVIADAVPAFAALPFKRFRQIFILPPDWESWQARISTHVFSPEQKAKRMAEAARSFQYALDTKELDFIINADLNEAADMLENFLSTNQPSLTSATGRIVAKNLLERLK